MHLPHIPKIWKVLRCFSLSWFLNWSGRIQCYQSVHLHVCSARPEKKGIELRWWMQTYKYSYYFSFHCSPKAPWGFLHKSALFRATYFTLLIQGKARTQFPHTKKLCARVSNYYGNRKGQPKRCAMLRPRLGRAAYLITASTRAR